MQKKTIDLIKSLQKAPFNINETQRQLKMSGESTIKYMCWGVSSIGFIGDTPSNAGAFIFKVSAHFHKGYVVITLGFDDTYNVHLISTQGNLKASFEGVYFDELTDTIDEKIEKIPAYKF